MSNYYDINKKVADLNVDFDERFNKGRERISSAGYDPDKLGLALLSFHGALEANFRLALASKVDDELAEKYLTPYKTSWNDLLPGAKEYLGLSQAYANKIADAIFYRNIFAHGEANSWDHEELLDYISFVEDWCSDKIIANINNTNQSTSDDQIGYRSYDYHYKPWYRSSCFMWLLFFIFPPIWGIIILTDENISVLIKILALIFSIISLIPWLYLL